MSFYYYMKGTTLGTVTTAIVGPDNKSEDIDTIPATSAAKWIFKSVTIAPKYKIFKIALTATVGGNTGDIAIDDIKFSGKRMR